MSVPNKVSDKQMYQYVDFVITSISRGDTMKEGIEKATRQFEHWNQTRSFFFNKYSNIQCLYRGEKPSYISQQLKRIFKQYIHTARVKNQEKNNINPIPVEKDVPAEHSVLLVPPDLLPPDHKDHKSIEYSIQINGDMATIICNTHTAALMINSLLG